MCHQVPHELYLSFRHIARHKVHCHKCACCDRTSDNASFSDGSEVSFISNRTERWTLEFQLIRRRPHSPSFLYFPFIRSVITIWLLFNRYCIKLRLTDFLFYPHAYEVLALDIILYLIFLVCFLCQSLVVIPPPSNIVVCVGSLLGTWVFVRVYLCCAVAIRLYVDIFLYPKYTSVKSRPERGKYCTTARDTLDCSC